MIFVDGSALSLAWYGDAGSVRFANGSFCAPAPPLLPSCSTLALRGRLNAAAEIVRAPPGDVPLGAKDGFERAKGDGDEPRREGYSGGERNGVSEPCCIAVRRDISWGSALTGPGVS